MNPWALIVGPIVDLVKRVMTVKDPQRTDRKPVDLKKPRLKKPQPPKPKDPQ
jgi:hypothetical protein